MISLVYLVLKQRMCSGIKLSLNSFFNLNIIIIILSKYQSTCWIKVSAFLFQNNLSWAFCLHVTDLQKSSISSLHLFNGLPLVDYYPWVSSLLPGMSIYCLTLLTCVMSRILVLLLAHSFVL